DVTALQIGIFAKTGVVNFSGPAGISFVKPTTPSYTFDSFCDVLVKGKERIVYTSSDTFSDNEWWNETPEPKMLFEPTPPWYALKGGRAEGLLIPGNLGAMLLLAGTEYWPNLD